MRDTGLWESAAARPRSTAFGEDAYPSIHEKTAALLHSIAHGDPPVDGDERACPGEDVEHSAWLVG